MDFTRPEQEHKNNVIQVAKDVKEVDLAFPE
jgi:hypothetical protein